METIKAFTDLSQSKKLAEILSLESADMLYWMGEYITHSYMEGQHKDEQIPIWSLSALLSILPDDCGIDKENGKYVASYVTPDECGTYTSNNPIDACYEVILYLHSLNLL